MHEDTHTLSLDDLIDNLPFYTNVRVDPHASNPQAQ
jgi:hypothetical protein